MQRGTLRRLKIVNEAVLAAGNGSLPILNVTLENQIRPEDDIDLARHHTANQRVSATL